MANALLRNGFHRGKVFRYSGSRVAMCGQRSDRARSRAPRQPSPKCPVQCLVKSLWLWGGPSLSNQAGSSTLSLFVISTTSEAKASPAAHGDDKPHSSMSDTRLAGSCVLALPQATVPGTPSTELLHEHRPRYCTNTDRGIARTPTEVLHESLPMSKVSEPCRRWAFSATFCFFLVALSACNLRRYY